jgi:hypothetical protein
LIARLIWASVATARLVIFSTFNAAVQTYWLDSGHFFKAERLGNSLSHSGEIRVISVTDSALWRCFVHVCDFARVIGNVDFALISVGFLGRGGGI